MKRWGLLCCGLLLIDCTFDAHGLPWLHDGAAPHDVLLIADLQASDRRSTDGPQEDAALDARQADAARPDVVRADTLRPDVARPDSAGSRDQHVSTCPSTCSGGCLTANGKVTCVLSGQICSPPGGSLPGCVCPAGMPCLIDCSKGCFGYIDCGQATACVMDCAGSPALCGGNLLCGPGPCAVSCGNPKCWSTHQCPGGCGCVPGCSTTDNCARLTCSR